MDYPELKQRLALSKFRSRFRLKEKDRRYIAEKGWNTIESQTRKIIGKRLAPAFPEKDGSQTPMRGHVVFTAQHATAACCRGCLEKYHHIPTGQALTDAEIKHVIKMILAWLREQAGDLSNYPTTADLFEQEENNS